MISDVIANRSSLPIRAGWPWRIATLVFLTVLADWLFFRHPVGISLALFVLAVGAGVLATNQTEANGRNILVYVGGLVAALLPILEDFNVMSASIAAIGIGHFALGITAALNGDLKDRFLAVGWFLISGPFQFLRDLPHLQNWARQRGAPAGLSAMQGWIVPLVFGAIFVALFAAANPLIANWLTQWNVGDSLKQFDPLRPLFWLGAIIVVWTFVCVNRRFALPNLSEAATSGDQQLHFASSDLATGLSPFAYSRLIFNKTAVLRSLVLFNLLFGLQTIMDIAYLWHGATLPDGMSYSSYAHRGAYPLIGTALLAAAFVIVAMQPGSNSERSRLTRALVFLWVGQNVMLVASAILRLDLYVATYLLTYWRVAAFIWMLLVATGLILIVIRIVTYRSNAWLISTNVMVLAATIYVCSFVNFANLVARYNVSHGDNALAAGAIDFSYLVGLGPHAIPALDRYFATHPVARRAPFALHRKQLAEAHLKDFSAWRAWTFRGWRLARYLETAKAQSALTPP